MQTMRTVIAAGFGLGLVMAACGPEVRRYRNPNHCANQRGNDWCVERYGDARGFCDYGCNQTLGRDGCVETRPAEDECYSPCGGEVNLLEDPSCLQSASTSSESGTSMGETVGESTASSGSESSSTTGPAPCERDEDCTEAEAPFCEVVSGECVGCDGTVDPDAACAGADPGSPVCVGGECVQCTAAAPEACTGTTPVCDEATNTCVPCTAHEQCGEAACNLFNGACLPGGADAIAHVGPGEEIASLGEAVMSFPGTEGTVIVHGGPSYDEFVTVDGGRTVAFLAADGDLPLWVLTAGGAPQLEVTAGSTVLMDGLQVSGNASGVGLRVNGGRAWVDRSRIIQNSGGGIVAEAGAELVLRNCFVGGDVDTNVVELQSATAEVLYSTLGASLGATASLTCDAPSMATVRNSLIISRSDDDEVVCGNLDATYTAAELLLDGTGNVTLGTMDVAWFAGFNAGDFDLTTMHPVAIDTAAQWSTGDPPTDIDGDPRPAVDGSPDHAGADVPQ